MLNRIIFWAAGSVCVLVFALTGCTTPVATAANGALAATNLQKPTKADFQRTWMLVSFHGFTRDQLVKHKAQTDWSNLTQAQAGMGCNTLGYSVTLASSTHATLWQTIAIGPVWSTRMACPDMRLEQAFAQRITTMIQAKVEGHQLTLRGADGETMGFVAADWD